MEETPPKRTKGMLSESRSTPAARWGDAPYCPPTVQAMGPQKHAPGASLQLTCPLVLVLQKGHSESCRSE